eukprot:CAMPEP_0170174628 /NCGR_PEP_ID=MMETSP0040_2-20121228/7827_1 /TAXON_ID=641309 /ORGANISM="Lotharella oceanica, Strain CCMP622" /LENGTH=168 /DNA_ID=CAMNT_0010416343 /DNA_START=191 /DNA_END=696 /DNA_ORIENTATION=-
MTDVYSLMNGIVNSLGVTDCSGGVDHLEDVAEHVRVEVLRESAPPHDARPCPAVEAEEKRRTPMVKEAADPCHRQHAHHLAYAPGQRHALLAHLFVDLLVRHPIERAHLVRTLQHGACRLGLGLQFFHREVHVASEREIFFADLEHSSRQRNGGEFYSAIKVVHLRMG